MIEKIGFIGCGNMASAIICGIIGNGILQGESINVFEPNTEKLNAFATENKIISKQSINDVVNASDITFFCVKPNVLPSVLQEISAENKAFVSIAAGVKYEKILASLPSGSRLLRIMPNTPLMAGLGASGFQIPSSLSDEEYNFIKKVFETLGVVAEVDGGLMDAVTGISGSGPAYVYYFIEAMAQAGTDAGIPYEDSLKLTLQTIKGAVKMVETSPKTPAVLKKEVCSPGGTTIEALAVFDENNMDVTIKKGIEACIAKSKKLSE